jgi:hypothetical protein
LTPDPSWTRRPIDLPEAKEKAARLQHRARSLIVLIVYAASVWAFYAAR